MATRLDRLGRFACILFPTMALSGPSCDVASESEAQEPHPIAIHPRNERYETHFDGVSTLTYADLLKRHEVPYAEDHGMRVEEADYHQRFVEAFRLTDAEKDVLRNRGFVVLPNPSRGAIADGPADLYYEVFKADLPVFVTADSILHAWHRSHDQLLTTLEIERMIPALRSMLDKTMPRLRETGAKGEDALLYVAVAASLLSHSIDPPRHGLFESQPAIAEEDPVERSLPPALQTSLRDIRHAIAAGLPTQVNWLGRETPMDFSLFRPRGHYAENPVLRDYFRAMMWLGKAELTLEDPGDPERSMRGTRAVHALARALVNSGAVHDLNRLESAYAAIVGPGNGASASELLTQCEGELNDDEPTPLRCLQAGQPAYSGHGDMSQRRSLTLRLVPQRFAYDAWIMAKTTTPELPPAVEGGRAMASVFDVAFVLSSDRAAQHLATDMAKPHRENLPAALDALRTTIAEERPTSVADTPYNHWLEALQALVQPHIDPRYPGLIRTAAWHDRSLEAMLASWAELRHDTVLMVEQSIGGIGCQFPMGYVDPVPELYRSLDRAAARFAPLFEGLPSEQWTKAFLAHWSKTMDQLSKMAERELSGQALPADDMGFLNAMVDRHIGYGGVRSYDGWYPKLFWTRHWKEVPASGSKAEGRYIMSLPYLAAGDSEPVVADVHTDMDRGVALQVGVGNPELLIAAVRHDGRTALYGGMAYGLYAFETPVSARMTDAEWRRLLREGEAPPRPSFARGYRASAEGVTEGQSRLR